MGMGVMGCRPAAGMTGGAVAAGGEVFACRQAPEAAVRIVTAGTAVMGRGCSTDQGVVVTVSAAGRCDPHQGTVIRGRDRVSRFPIIRMAGEAVAAAGRDTGLEVRNRGVTEGAITQVGYGDRGIGGRPRVVTGHTGSRSAGDIAARHMVEIAVSRQLGRMAIQTVGGIGSSRDGVDDLLSRAVMTGGAGTGPVGGNIMLGAFDLSPVRHHMTAAAGCAVRKVAGTQGDCVGVRTMTNYFIGMAVGTGCLVAA